ncbi:DUF386 domain-containing protein [Lonepinella koalarum]|uniref:YhcH/YjgK/YiaL family protein n=1 Tax=Lonepinella koalarum TaxID=53417 RepID=UPI0011E3BD7B|nr:YhcH/YjgK/YiaL family protein [Lonepinella koalarum]TYG34719.1 DUF386 domain-containing protein [Lonepinella koalarum]
MITGNLNQLALASLPVELANILAEPEVSFSNLITLADGKYQKQGESWFYTVGDFQTSPKSARHTEYHKEYLDIQVVLNGEEIIGYQLENVINSPLPEKKPDFYLLENPQLNNEIHLKAGDFAIFYPGEPHQALCMVNEPKTVRKAVFKVPKGLVK